MRDLDTELAELRDELHRAVAVPEVAGIAERSRQRVVRRRVQGGAVVAVLVVAAAVPVLRAQLAPDPAPPATPPTASSPPTTPPATDAGAPFVTAVGFADADHGYALRSVCPSPGSSEAVACEMTLLATDDRRSWEVVATVPEPRDATATGLGELRVLGTDEVAVDWAVAGAPPAPVTARVHSGDGGRTWRDVPPAAVPETVSAIPEHAELQRVCPYHVEGPSCGTPGFAVVLPGSGASARLTGDPGLVGSVPGAVPTADGHWWVAGQRPGSPRWSLAVSDDDGRTWTTAEVDWRDPATEWSVVSGHQVLYASARGREPVAEPGLRAIFRSDDGGRTWTRTWWSDGARQLVGFDGTLVAAADGSLTVNEYGPTRAAHRSTDGGATLAATAPARLGAVRWTRAGYLAGAERTFELSADGLDWQRFDIPLE